MNDRKTITIDLETWKELHKIRLKLNKRTLKDTVKFLIENYKEKTQKKR